MSVSEKGKSGSLVLIPTPLSSHPLSLSHPPDVIARVRKIRSFAVEKLPSAVKFLRQIEHPLQDFELRFHPLDKRVTALQLTDIVKEVESGLDVGVLSEAGSPGIADPGSELVWMCHQRNLNVEVLVGPSAVTLSLAASGLNGQSFAFHGYLPVRPDERQQKINEHARLSRNGHQTQLYIEAPHRNSELLQALLDALPDTSKLCVCWNLLGEETWVKSSPLSDWDPSDAPEDFNRRPAMFLFLSGDVPRDAAGRGTGSGQDYTGGRGRQGGRGRSGGRRNTHSGGGSKKRR